MTLESASRDEFSLNGYSATGLDQDEEPPAGLGSGSGLAHETLEKLFEIAPVQKCEEWIGVSPDLEM